MSSTHLAWAFEQDCPSPQAKLVLIGAAECVDKDSGRGWISKSWLMKFAGLDLDGVQFALVDLRHADLIRWYSYCVTHCDVGVGPGPHGANPWPEQPAEVNYEPRPHREPWLGHLHRKRSRLWEVQQGRCWYCGCNVACHEGHWIQQGYAWKAAAGFADPVIEHQVPRSRGGPNRPHNRVLACALCNVRKRDRTVDEFRIWCEQRVGEPVQFFGEQLLAATPQFGGEQ